MPTATTPRPGADAMEKPRTKGLSALSPPPPAAAAATAPPAERGRLTKKAWRSICTMATQRAEKNAAAAAARRELNKEAERAKQVIAKTDVGRGRLRRAASSGAGKRSKTFSKAQSDRKVTTAKEKEGPNKEERADGAKASLMKLANVPMLASMDKIDTSNVVVKDPQANVKEAKTSRKRSASASPSATRRRNVNVKVNVLDDRSKVFSKPSRAASSSPQKPPVSPRPASPRSPRGERSPLATPRQPSQSSPPPLRVDEAPLPFSCGSSPRRFEFQTATGQTSPGTGAYSVDPSVFRARDHRRGGPQPMGYRTNVDKGLVEYGPVTSGVMVIKRTPQTGSVGPGTYESQRYRTDFNLLTGRRRTHNAKLRQQVKDGRLRAPPGAKIKFPVAHPPPGFYTGDYTPPLEEDPTPPENIQQLPGFGHVAPKDTKPSVLSRDVSGHMALPKPLEPEALGEVQLQSFRSYTSDSPKNEGEIVSPMTLVPRASSLKRRKSKSPASPRNVTMVVMSDAYRGESTLRSEPTVPELRTPERKEAALAASRAAAREVEAFLSTLHLEAYTESLMEEGYDDMRSLAVITENDLLQLGMKRGHRARLLKELEERASIEVVRVCSEPPDVQDLDTTIPLE
eukprot:TRINITY_DN20784_c0_g1_i1.p1 TRINITY_DN20784_c0_g1~~TRINITY_DN20784_c0_g1_i1.p1  ORF type:complete len:627 (+),score=188.99 TRINITY_DN20784_c0_g1_i1:84-1964(+)